MVASADKLPMHKIQNMQQKLVGDALEKLPITDIFAFSKLRLQQQWIQLREQQILQWEQQPEL